MSLLRQLATHWRAPLGNHARFFSQRAGIPELITHAPALERPSLADISARLDAIQAGLKEAPDLSPSDRDRLSETAMQLSQFELGRFLIANRGALSGWWTYYCILGYKQAEISHPLERFLLEEAPTALATRERFGIFQSVVSLLIEDKAKLTDALSIASIPGGMAADMLTLPVDVDPSRCRLKFVSIDLDKSVFDLACGLADQLGCKLPLEQRCQDAWSLSARGEFDIAMSNGLNIYVPERERVVALYESLLSTLKPGGTLVTSALTPPPPAAEWKFDAVDPDALTKQAAIFAHILQATWANFCMTDEMFARLEEAGAVNVRVIPDSRNMFPTFVAERPSA